MLREICNSIVDGDPGLDSGPQINHAGAVLAANLPEPLKIVAYRIDSFKEQPASVPACCNCITG